MVSVERIKEYAEIETDVSMTNNKSHIAMSSTVNVKQLGQRDRVPHSMGSLCIYTLA